MRRLAKLILAATLLATLGLALPQNSLLRLRSAVISSAYASDISPGRWEISLETRVADQPGFAPEPFRTYQCFTAADASNPSRILGPMSNQGATDCNYSDTRYSGDSFSFSMRCSGAFAIQSRGQVRYTSDSIDGSIVATANVGGAVVEFQNRVSGRRIGDC